MQITLRRDIAGPLYRQVFETLRLAILDGFWKAEQRLPATRELASQLALSRNTVNTAYEMLLAEGYITARVGSGYFVAGDLPTIAGLGSPRPNNKPAPDVNTVLSARGTILAKPSRPVSVITNPAFQPGMPDMSRFPYRQWEQCVQRAAQNPPASLTGYQDQGGHFELKRALSQYLQVSRGVVCEPEQVVVVNGSQAGLDLIARMLIDEGEYIAVEEPGYTGAKDAFQAAGARILPVDVDDEGLSVDALDTASKQCPGPVPLVYATPSYQFPLGVTMSAARRIQLLNWAKRNQALIIEDDYDSEFRYRERPLSSMQGLDPQRVIYLGTFSKVMFPGLRLGYLVVPESLAKPLAFALRKTGQDPPLIWQAAMADFIDRGHFASHLQKMRKCYGEKQELLLELIRRHLDDYVTVIPIAAGMQLACFFRHTVDEQSLVKLGRQQNLLLAPLSRYYHDHAASQRKGLFLGYSAIPLEALEENIIRLRECFEALSKHPN